MHEDRIKVGDRIEISAKNNELKKSFISQVDQVLDKKNVVVHVPIAYGYLVKLPLNKVYEFLFFTDKGMIKADAKVERHFTEDGFHMMSIALVSPGERVQRREFFRFESIFPIRFGVLAVDYDPKTNIPEPVMYEAVAKDISGGGMKFVSNTDAEAGAAIKCSMPLGKDHFFATAKILEKKELRSHGPRRIAPYKFQYRVMFLDLTSDEKEKIVKYIFAEQRKALKRS